MAKKVGMPHCTIPLSVRLGTRVCPPGQMRAIHPSHHTAADRRSVRMAGRLKMRRQGSGFVQYVYQQTKLGIAMSKAKIAAARKGEKFEMPEHLKKWAGSIARAGRMLLGKR